MTKSKLRLIDTLNDTCFVYASEAMSELCRMIESEIGEKPSLSNLCDVLTASLRCCGEDLFQDVNVQAIEKLTAKVTSRKKIVLKPGDVFAVPRKAGGYYFVVYITSSRFGEAFGVLQDYGRIAHMPSDTPTPAGPPVYTGKTFVINGRWRRIAHREDILELFPSSPEIYHTKADNPSNSNIGQFGSAESPDGELRALSETEAQQIELDKGIYQQILLEEQFETFLQNKLK